MTTKHLLLGALLFLALSLQAQNVHPVAFSPPSKNVDYPNATIQEKAVYIHRHVLEDKVDIEVEAAGKAVFSLLNAKREEFRRYEMTFYKKTTHRINVAGLTTGQYYIRVQKDNETFVRKIEIVGR